jgi:hypothetical protein
MVLPVGLRVTNRRVQQVMYIIFYTYSLSDWLCLATLFVKHVKQQSLLVNLAAMHI